MSGVAYILKAVAESEREEGKLAALMTIVDMACVEIGDLERQCEYFSELYDEAWGEFSRWKNNLKSDDRTALTYMEMVDRMTCIIRALIDDATWTFGDPVDGVEYNPYIV